MFELSSQARSASVSRWFRGLLSGACGALFVVSQLFWALGGSFFVVDNLIGELTFRSLTIECESSVMQSAESDDWESADCDDWEDCERIVR
jgi:hypothetical protein